MCLRCSGVNASLNQALLNNFHSMNPFAIPKHTSCNEALGKRPKVCCTLCVKNALITTRQMQFLASGSGHALMSQLLRPKHLVNLPNWPPIKLEGSRRCHWPYTPGRHPTWRQGQCLQHQECDTRQSFASVYNRNSNCCGAITTER